MPLDVQGIVLDVELQVAFNDNQQRSQSRTRQHLHDSVVWVKIAFVLVSTFRIDPVTSGIVEQTSLDWFKRCVWK